MIPLGRFYYFPCVLDRVGRSGYCQDRKPAVVSRRAEGPGCTYASPVPLEPSPRIRETCSLPCCIPASHLPSSPGRAQGFASSIQPADRGGHTGRGSTGRQRFWSTGLGQMVDLQPTPLPAQAPALRLGPGIQGECLMYHPEHRPCRSGRF